MRTQQRLAVAFLALCALAAATACRSARGARPPACQGNPDREREREQIAVLQSDAPLFDKAKACQQLALVGSGEAVPVLAALLDDESLSDYARFALEPIADPSVDAALREALGRLRGRRLVGVVNSVGVRRDPQAVKALKRLVRDSDAGVGPEALGALGRIATNDAVRAIRKVLDAGPETLRPAAADAALTAAESLLARGERRKAVRLYDAVRKADLPEHIRAAGAYGAILARGADGTPLLLEQLRADRPAAVAVALRAARELPGRKATQALADELQDLPVDLQAQVVKALADRQEPSVRPRLEGLARSGHPGIRVESLKALGRVGGASSLPVLLEAACDGRNAPESDAALASLTQIEAEETDAAILGALASAHPPVRARLIGVLDNRRAASAVEALLIYAAEDDAAVSKAAFRALGSLSRPERLPELVRLATACRDEAVRKSAEAAVASAARRIEEEKERDDVVSAALARTDDEEVRRSLLRILGAIANDDALAVLRRALEDPSPGVRDTAVRELAEWPNVKAASSLFGVLKETENETQRILALRGYVRLLGLGSERSVEETLGMYKEAIELAQRPEEKRLILSGLAQVNSPKALDLVKPFLDEEAVRAEAALAGLQIVTIAGTGDSQRAKAVLSKILAAAVDEDLREKARAALGEIERYEDHIIDWQVSGPYAEEGKTYSALFDVAFPPEQPGAGGVQWSPMPSRTDPRRPWILDLLKAIGGEQRAAYLRTGVYSPKRQPARLEMGSDDGVKVWLNGRLVHANNIARAAIPGSDTADAVLAKGWNAVLVKITQNAAPWEFCLRIRKRDGSKIEGLKVNAARPPAPPTAGAAAAAAEIDFDAIEARPLFDGVSFDGWEGNLEMFRIEDGAIVGGRLGKSVPRNEFLCTTREYGDFELRLKCKLVRGQGNAGIQIRSRRVPNHHEVSGYQADMATGMWGNLYDESRRNRVLAAADGVGAADQAKLAQVLKPDGWNEYVIRCAGRRVQLWVNGCRTVDYTELDDAIERSGIIGLQIHGGPPSEAWYKDITIKEPAADR